MAKLASLFQTTKFLPQIYIIFANDKEAGSPMVVKVVKMVKVKMVKMNFGCVIWLTINKDFSLFIVAVFDKWKTILTKMTMTKMTTQESCVKENMNDPQWPYTKWGELVLKTARIGGREFGGKQKMSYLCNVEGDKRQRAVS